MKTIWKYELETTDDQWIDMPIGAEPLTVQVQHEVPCLWALVNPQAPLAKVHVRIFGTGHSFVGSVSKYVGTYQLHNGSFVGHVFIA